MAWDETSGYGAAEATRAAIGSVSPDIILDDQGTPRAWGGPR
jgi:hypothetical protein